MATNILTPDQQDRVLDLLTELAREKGERLKLSDLKETDCGCEPAEYLIAEGDADAREDVADRCASLLREIRGYV